MSAWHKRSCYSWRQIWHLCNSHMLFIVAPGWMRLCLLMPQGIQVWPLESSHLWGFSCTQLSTIICLGLEVFLFVWLGCCLFGGVCLFCVVLIKNFPPRILVACSILELDMWVAQLLGGDKTLFLLTFLNYKGFPLVFFEFVSPCL